MDPLRAKGRHRKNSRDEQRAQTQQRLLDAARDLFKEHGFEDVSVVEIGRAAGVSHSLINTYFNGKAGLLYELVRQNNTPQWSRSQDVVKAGEEPAQSLWKLLLLWAETDSRDPRLLGVMQSYSWIWPPETEVENRAERLKFKALIAELVARGQATGVFRSSLDPELSAQAIFAIYTWGLRPAVFAGLSPETCMEQIRAQAEALLLA